VSSLDPAVDWQGWFTVRYAISETLFKLDMELVPEPWLAESYENVDTNTWKITIKDKVTFSNGDPLTAEMVVNNLKRVGSTNKRAAAFGEAAYVVAGNVITITTASPFPTLINELCDPYTSIIDLDKTADLDKAPIGTGPYVVADFVEKTTIDLTANKNYWDGTPKIDTVQVKFVTDTDTMAMALQSGEVDVAMNLTSDSRETFESNNDFKIEEVSTSRAYFLYYNLQTVADQAVRQAISMAIDKEGMADFLFDGSITPAVGAFPNDLAYGGSHLKGAIFNVEEAKKVLSAAGYIDTDGDGIVEKDGKPLSVSIVTYKRLKNEAIVTELQSELKAIGIGGEVTVHDNSDFFKAGEFDIGIYSIVTTAVGDPQRS
jgi:ABC-type dipeptide transport system, periplasmic component